LGVAWLSHERFDAGGVTENWLDMLNTRGVRPTAMQRRKARICQALLHRSLENRQFLYSILRVKFGIITEVIRPLFKVNMVIIQINEAIKELQFLYCFVFCVYQAIAEKCFLSFNFSLLALST
jgi:hypothetical protein